MGKYARGAIAIIVVAVLLRIVFISQSYPVTNSDESTMGLMALHIAYRGEHPTFFYDQNYMGSLEAYLGAAFFHLFGPSTFSLRLGLIRFLRSF
jgi:predicted membrane-bound mannosyltransferase